MGRDIGWSCGHGKLSRMSQHVKERRRKPGTVPTLGLVLTGGGARSAYQVGVLKALVEMLPRARNPFEVIVGTSAGAVAAGVLASEAHHWRRAVAGLESVWANFHVAQVFHSDRIHMLRGGLHWLISLVSSGVVLSPPKALLDNDPLWDLLKTSIDWAGVRTSIRRGHLRALALCATSYVSGQSVAFFDGVEEIPEWTRAQRIGRRTKLTLDHLMASAAIPMLFPPIPLNNEYFGDGAMRQLNPLSPAVHLGADRMLIVGVRARRAAGVAVPRQPVLPPTPGQIFGYMLDTLFTDQVFGDLEQLERINQLVLAAPQAAPGLRCVETLMLAPSVDPREIAARTSLRCRPACALLRVMGAKDVSAASSRAISCSSVAIPANSLNLGYKDAMDTEDALLAFAGEKPSVASTAAAPAVAQAT